MKKWIVMMVAVLVSSTAMANEFFALRDWTAYKNVMTPLNKKGCLAETIAEVDNNGVTEKWMLQVIRLEAGNGEYTYPIIISYPESQTAKTYYEASAQSNKSSSQVFNMTLLQPSNGDQSIVAVRTQDRNNVIARLKGDSTFTVSYLDKMGAVREVPFSLRGSSKTISALRRECL